MGQGKRGWGGRGTRFLLRRSTLGDVNAAVHNFIISSQFPRWALGRSLRRWFLMMTYAYVRGQERTPRPPRPNHQLSVTVIPVQRGPGESGKEAGNKNARVKWWVQLHIEMIFFAANVVHMRDFNYLRELSDDKVARTPSQIEVHLVLYRQQSSVGVSKPCRPECA